MPEYCPKCDNELLPYLKTGELKRVVEDKLVLYQLHWCPVCKDVYYSRTKTFGFKNLRKEQDARRIKDDGVKKKE